MSTPTSRSLEALVPRQEHVRNPFLPEADPSLTEPAVLEAIQDVGRYQQSPVSLLCPGCGTVVDRYREGLPPRLGRVAETCSECGTTLHRWSIVAIATAHETLVSEKQLRRVVTEYWDNHLWKGITTGGDYPRTDEYSRLYEKQAAAWDWEWEVSCPLCRRSLTDTDADRLDYHHWSRDPDQGVCLCRACHRAISAGQRDEELDWVAQERGFIDKHDLQLIRLALREQAVIGHSTLAELAETLSERYYVIQPAAEVYALLAEALTDNRVRDRLSPQHVLADLPATSETE